MKNLRWEQLKEYHSLPIIIAMLAPITTSESRNRETPKEAELAYKSLLLKASPIESSIIIKQELKFRSVVHNILCGFFYQ